MKFGKYAENCCKILENTVEYPTDIYLVQLVRMQRIADNIKITIYNETLDGSPDFSPVLSINIASLERELRDVRSTLQLDLPQAGKQKFPVPLNYLL
jgi:hypothetical protein